MRPDLASLPLLLSWVFSIGFGSGHSVSRMLISLSIHHFLDALAVCFRSLSCFFVILFYKLHHVFLQNPRFSSSFPPWPLWLGPFALSCIRPRRVRCMESIQYLSLQLRQERALWWLDEHRYFIPIEIGISVFLGDKCKTFRVIHLYIYFFI